MSELSILFLGDIDRPEFLGARGILESSGRVSCFAEAESAIGTVESGGIMPDITVIAQAFPGQFSQQTVDRLRRLAPLCRIVGLLGSWCEGEIRSGHPWPAAMRIYWHQWNVRARSELRRLLQDKCPSWGLPMTATEEERLLQTPPHPLANRPGLIAIHTPLFVMADWLSAACRTCGYSTVWLRPSSYTYITGAAAVVFDASNLQGGDLHHLRRLSAALGRTPIITLLDFPRVEDQRQVLAAGASAVVSKPLNLDDLYWQLEQVCKVGNG